MELYTVKETAKMLKVSPITVRRYIASGELAAERVGRAIRIRREAIEGFIEPVVPPREPTTFHEALGISVGIGRSREPSNIAKFKDEYIADAIAGTWEDERESGESLGKPFTFDDPLWEIVGIGHSEGPDDVATNKHKYLADAILSEMN